MAQSSRSSEALEKPQSSIGAQDLLTVSSPSKAGFVRKQGQLERTFKFLKWRQRFVVLSRGCIYIYKDEFSNSPMRSLSMKGFKKCKRVAEGSTMRWAFDLLPPETDTTHKTLSFACSDDSVRREWMRACVEEIMKALHVTDQDTLRRLAPGDRDEYVYLERAIQNPPPAAGSSDEEGSNDEAEYQTIDEAKLAHGPGTTEKRPAAAFSKKKSDKATVGIVKPTIGKSKPKPKTPPDSPTGSGTRPRKGLIPRDSFQYEGSDRNTIKDLLTVRPEGTYLVRKSRNDNREVLSVNIEGNLKEYKIYNRDSGFTINNKDHFTSVEELLSHYTTSLLPNKTARLYRPFSQTDPGYVN